MKKKRKRCPKGLQALREKPGQEGLANHSAFTLLANLLRSPGAAFFTLIRLKGNLKALVHSSLEELQGIPLVGPIRALQIKSAIQLTARIQQYCPHKPTLCNSLDVYSLFGQSMEDLDKEHLRVILLNTQKRLLETTTVSIGTLTSLLAGTREIFRPALAHPSCSFIILMHNHPSGDPEPSPEDITTLSRLVQAGDLLGIKVLDSIIVGQNNYYSFRDQELIK